MNTRNIQQNAIKSKAKSCDKATLTSLGFSVPAFWLTGLFIVTVQVATNPAQAQSLEPVGSSEAGHADDFQFDWRNLNSLQYSRSGSDAEPVSEVQTELSFKLSPGKFNFSTSGAFGLGGVFSNPELAVSSSMSGKYRLQDAIPELHNGLSYSADVKIEQESKNIPDTVYVSSSQLGISYGRLGQVWYGGIDLSIGSFSSASSPIANSSEVLSFDLTTGRKMQITGVGKYDPLWLLSLQGNFDIHGKGSDDPVSDRSDWYINPSLFWNNPGFTFSAQLQLPVDSSVWRDFEHPDYRLRAIFEKRFR